MAFGQRAAASCGARGSARRPRRRAGRPAARRAPASPRASAGAGRPRRAPAQQRRQRQVECTTASASHSSPCGQTPWPSTQGRWACSTRASRQGAARWPPARAPDSARGAGVRAQRLAARRWARGSRLHRALGRWPGPRRRFWPPAAARPPSSDSSAAHAAACSRQRPAVPGTEVVERRGAAARFPVRGRGCRRPGGAAGRVADRDRGGRWMLSPRRGSPGCRLPGRDSGWSGRSRAGAAAVSGAPVATAAAGACSRCSAAAAVSGLRRGRPPRLGAGLRRGEPRWVAPPTACACGGCFRRAVPCGSDGSCRGAVARGAARPRVASPAHAWRRRFVTPFAHRARRRSQGARAAATSPSRRASSRAMRSRACAGRRDRGGAGPPRDRPVASGSSLHLSSGWGAGQGCGRRGRARSL